MTLLAGSPRTSPTRIRGHHDPAEVAIAEIASGRPVVVLGNTGTDGGIVFAASHATTAMMAFAVRHTSGFICVALPPDRCDALGLPPMLPICHVEAGTTFCVTVDATTGGTGISATDRATTARLLADPSATQLDFTRPGHMVPVSTAAGGVGPRDLAGTALDLAQLSGEPPAAVFAQLTSPADPTRMAGDRELARFGARHGITVLDPVELVTPRRTRAASA